MFTSGAITRRSQQTNADCSTRRDPGAYAGRAIRSEAQIDAIRRHVDELSQGAAFKGSHRSQQFLRYIVEKTLAGSVEGVKERTIGVELFQKSPTYDTVFQFRSFTGSKIPGQTLVLSPRNCTIWPEI